MEPTVALTVVRDDWPWFQIVKIYEDPAGLNWKIGFRFIEPQLMSDHDVTEGVVKLLDATFDRDIRGVQQLAARVAEKFTELGARDCTYHDAVLTVPPTTNWPVIGLTFKCFAHRIDDKDRTTVSSVWEIVKCAFREKPALHP